MTQEHTLRQIILAYLRDAGGIEQSASSLPDVDLVASGLLDSLGFVQLIAEIERHVGFEIQFDEVDGEELTRVEPLIRRVVQQTALQSQIR